VLLRPRRLEPLGSDQNDVTESIEQLRARCAAFGQDHVFRFWPSLEPERRRALAAQAARIDLGELQRTFQATQRLAAPGSRKLEPAPVEALPSRGGDPGRRQAARERGETLLREARVGALVVAGGQGTRLGFDGPKGVFPLGPATGRSLFELQAQKLRNAIWRWGVPIPWYVMTSPATDAPTREFFARQRWFGLPADDVFFLCQSMAPALDFQGRLLLDAPDRIVESPNGHGGAFQALADSGALDDLDRRGITTLSYYQVDNPLVPLLDPVFLGLHALEGAEMSAKVVRKVDPMEKVGVLARVDGRIGVVEYTEIDDLHRNQRDESGELVYWAGSIAIHALETAFVRRVAGQAERLLPYHASAKKIPFLDEAGRLVKPAEPNGYKLERFLFDALPAADRVAILEIAREDEYAPVKNAEGSDSPETARRGLDALARRWLAAAGVDVPPDVWVELDHARIDGADDVRALGIRSLPHEAIRLAPRGG
jgi:UDP-N-acetylglucosamine/UDP-N-acetylgalactosamine diphosphorylase